MSYIKDTLNKVSSATGTFKDKTLNKVQNVFNGNPPQLMLQLQGLHTQVRRELAASEDLKCHPMGHFLNRSKANALAAAIRRVENCLVVIDRSYPGGVEQLYDTYSLTAYPIPAQGHDGVAKETVRPLLEAVYADIGRVYTELTFHEAVWDAEFPLTKMHVKRILGRDGWKGGWLFSDFSEENPVCHWIESKAGGPMLELR